MEGDEVGWGRPGETDLRLRVWVVDRSAGGRQ